MTDSGKHANSHKTHSVTDNEHKSETCPSDLAHFALLRLGSAGLLPKVLEALAHIGVDLVDHFCEKDWGGPTDEQDLEWDSEEDEDLLDE